MRNPLAVLVVAVGVLGAMTACSGSSGPSDARRVDGTKAAVALREEIVRLSTRGLAAARDELGGSQDRLAAGDPSPCGQSYDDRFVQIESRAVFVVSPVVSHDRVASALRTVWEREGWTVSELTTTETGTDVVRWRATTSSGVELVGRAALEDQEGDDGQRGVVVQVEGSTGCLELSEEAARELTRQYLAEHPDA